MNEHEIIEYIFQKKYKSLSNKVYNWLRINQRFMSFISEYRDKIRRVIREQNNIYQIEDRIIELEVAHLLLLNTRFDIEYEKDKKNGKSQDLFVTFENIHKFFIEIKHVRMNEYEILFDKFIEEISSEIKSLPFKIYFSIESNFYNYDRHLLERINSNKANIVEFIKKTISDKYNSLTPGELNEYQILGFENEINLLLSKPEYDTDIINPTVLVPNRRISYTQKEFRKFGDIIFEKIEQIKENNANLILIYSDSTTHFKVDLFRAVNNIRKAIDHNDMDFFKKKKTTISSFVNKYKFLSGIIIISKLKFPSKHENLLWLNDYFDTRFIRIPNSALEYLQSMKYL